MKAKTTSETATVPQSALARLLTVGATLVPGSALCPGNTVPVAGQFSAASPNGAANTYARC